MSEPSASHWSSRSRCRSNAPIPGAIADAAADLAVGDVGSALPQRLVDRLDAAVLTTGTTAYRRRDGVAVIPLALLGP